MTIKQIANISKNYPKIIFVQTQNEKTNDEYLQAEKDLADLLNDGYVAIYQLKEMKKRKTDIRLED